MRLHLHLVCTCRAKVEAHHGRIQGQVVQPQPLKNYKLLYISLEILVRPTRKAIGPFGLNCFLREVHSALYKIC